MSCSPFDLKDYFLKELPDPQQHQVEAHIRTCEPCREELDRLQITEAALFSLRDEEIPQRIGFVSDKIFEPSPWRRQLAAFWGSTARLAFASAAMLSAAILLSVVWQRTAPAPVPTVATIATVSAAEIESRINTAVAKAVGEAEARQVQQTRQLVAELESTRQRLLVAAAEYDMSQRRAGAIRETAYVMPPADRGEPK
jgi:anti-sigma factor RsiW